jgi:hypothetical protein
MGLSWKEPWETDVIPLEVFTGDRRWFSAGSLTSRALPLPLCLQIQTDKAHRGAITVGVVDWIKFGQTMVRAGGTWMDPRSIPEVSRALELTRRGVARVSADLEPDMDVRVEEGETPESRPYIFYDRARICGVTIVPIGAFDLPGLSMPFGDEISSLALTGTTGWRTMPALPREAEYNADQAFKNILAWADGNDRKARSMFLWVDPQAAEGARDRFRLPIGDVVNGHPALSFHAIYSAAALVSGAHGGLPTVSDEEKGRLRRTISEIYLRLAGLYNDPELTAPWDKRAKLPDVSASGLEAVAASAAPIAPPDAWFTDPNLPGPTPSPIVTAEGRVMVHLTTHGTCHRAIQQATGQCFTPPPSPSGYRRFTDGTILTASGAAVPVGRITANTTHPELTLGPDMTKRHYDDTGTCVAVVAAGDDEYGTWLSGALVPEATAEQVAMLRRGPLSGDWRRHGAEGLDLVMALAVNVAGYPAPYQRAVRTLSIEDGECLTLVASGSPGEDNGGMSSAAEPPEVVPAQPADAPPQLLPVIDPGEIISAAAAAAVATIRIQDLHTERLATLLAVDAADQAARLDRLGGLIELAPMDSAESRRAALKRGQALPPLREGGTARYPIRNVEDLDNAIKAVGRGKGNHNELRRWIIRRARELNASNRIPENWNPDGSLKGQGE